MFVLLDLRRCAADTIGRYDASSLSGDEAVSALRTLGEVRRLVDTMIASTTRRVEATAAYRGRGDRSTADTAAKALAASAHEARTFADAGKAIEADATLSTAAQAGKVTPAQAALIGATLEHDPDAAVELLAAAEGGMTALRDKCIEVRNRVESESDRRSRQRRSRSLNMWTDHDGMACGRWRLQPEIGASVKALIDAGTESTLRARKSSADHEPIEAYAADVFVELVLRDDEAEAEDAESVDAVDANERAAENLHGEGNVDRDDTASSDRQTGDAGLGQERPDELTGSEPADCATKTDPAPIQHVELDAGSSNDGQLRLAELASDSTPSSTHRCDLRCAEHERHAGANRATRRARQRKQRKRVSVNIHVVIDHSALVRGEAFPGERCEIPGVGPVNVAWVRDMLGDAFLTATIANGVDIHTVAHFGRHINATLRTALLVQGRECDIEGCGQRGYLEIDHRHDHAKGGPTSLRNLGWLCAQHHRLKTQGWTLSPPDPATGKRTLAPPANHAACAA